MLFVCTIKFLFLSHKEKQIEEYKTANKCLFLTVLIDICFVVGILFVIGGFIIFPQLERASNVIQLQLMCGIRAYSYWLYTYMFDLFVFVLMVFVLLMCVVFYEGAFGCGTFSGCRELGKSLLWMCVMCVVCSLFDIITKNKLNVFCFYAVRLL